MHGMHGREALLRPRGLRATEGVWLLWQQLSSPLRWWVRHPGGQIRLYQLDYTAIPYLSKSAVKPACAARSHQHQRHLCCHTQLWKQSPSILCKKWRWGLANYYCLQYWITAECFSVTACTPYPCSNTGIFTLWHSLCQMCLFIWAPQCKVWHLPGCFSGQGRWSKGFIKMLHLFLLPRRTSNLAKKGPGWKGTFHPLLRLCEEQSCF